MKKPLFSILFVLFGLLIKAQMPMGAMSSGKVIGLVVDETSSKPLEYVTVALCRNSDSVIVSGGLTEANGQFKIEKVTMGRYILKVSFVGYKTIFTKPFNITFQENEVDLGKIKIKTGAKDLKEVTVSGEKPDFVQEVDKKVYNVEKNVTSTGGTANDVLQTVPSVTVDIDGKISLRGSQGVTVLIDGKPSGLTGVDKQAALAQIPASAIESVEIITNPSAKYDAEGMAGIINIITKKDRLRGLNLNATIGAGSHDKYNTTLAINNRTSKLNVYANYSFRHESRSGWKKGEQLFSLTDTSYYYNNSGNSLRKSDVHTGKLGADWYIDNYNTLGVYGNVNVRSEKNQEVTIYDYLNENKARQYGFVRYGNDADNAKSYEANLDYKHSFSGSKKTLSFVSNFSQNPRTQLSNYSDPVSIAHNVSYQKSNTVGKFTSGVAQLDFSNPGPDGKFETGIKYTYRLNDSKQEASKYNYTAESYFLDAKYSNQFIYDERVAAGYFMWSSKIKKLEYSTGLRAEQTNIIGNNKTSNQQFTNEYLNFFPTLSTKYSTSKQYDFTLSYSKRLNRPNAQMLNPFVDYSDTVNLRGGNPYLQPEYIHSFDFSVNKMIKMKYLVSLSTYYRHTDNLMTMYRNVNATTGVSFVQSVNFSSSENYGGEVMFRMGFGPMAKKGSLMVFAALFQNKINASNIDPSIQSNALNYNARVIANYKITPSTSVQAIFMYMGPMVNGQSTITGMSGGDLGIKQDFWKGRGNLSINLQDVANMRKFQIVNKTAVGIYDGYRKRESRVLMVTFGYRFGSNDDVSQKRKASMEQSMPSGGDMGGF